MSPCGGDVAGTSRRRRVFAGMTPKSKCRREDKSVSEQEARNLWNNTDWSVTNVYTTDVSFSVEYKPLNIVVNVQWILTHTFKRNVLWNCACHNMPILNFNAICGIKARPHCCWTKTQYPMRWEWHSHQLRGLALLDHSKLATQNPLFCLDMWPLLILL